MFILLPLETKESIQSLKWSIFRADGSEDWFSLILVKFSICTVPSPKLMPWFLKHLEIKKTIDFRLTALKFRLRRVLNQLVTLLHRYHLHQWPIQIELCRYPDCLGSAQLGSSFVLDCCLYKALMCLKCKIVLVDSIS